MPLRSSVRLASVATALVVAPALAAAQSSPTVSPAPAVRAEPLWHVSANPVAPLALSFFGDVEGRVADEQSLGVGIGYTNLPDKDALLTLDAKYRFWLGEREFEGWSVAPTVGFGRFTEDQGCRDADCIGGRAVARTSKGSFGVQVDHTWRTRRGRVAVTAGVGAKRFFGGDNAIADVTFLPNARLSLGVLF
jgi:hypothetical protein